MLGIMKDGGAGYEKVKIKENMNIDILTWNLYAVTEDNEYYKFINDKFYYKWRFEIVKDNLIDDSLFDI